MGQKMTWEEMKKAFPDEWLLIVDYETDASGHVMSGIVERHALEKDDVFFPPVVDKNCAFKYTGESTFPGGWRCYAQSHDRAPAIGILNAFTGPTWMRT